MAIKDRVFAETIQLIPQFNSMRIYAHDITERTRTEEALRQSEQQYRIMGETLPYGVWLVDANGRAVHVSQSYLDLIEMTLEQMQQLRLDTQASTRGCRTDEGKMDALCSHRRALG